MKLPKSPRVADEIRAVYKPQCLIIMPSVSDKVLQWMRRSSPGAVPGVACYARLANPVAQALLTEHNILPVTVLDYSGRLDWFAGVDRQCQPDELRH